MSNRFEISLRTYLVGLFIDKLRKAIADAGFRQALHVPEPDITQFNKGNEVLSLEIGHPHDHRQSIVVESETADVDLLVGNAVKESVLELADQLLFDLPWVDNAEALRAIEAPLASLILRRR